MQQCSMRETHGRATRQRIRRSTRGHIGCLWGSRKLFSFALKKTPHHAFAFYPAHALAWALARRPAKQHDGDDVPGCLAKALQGEPGPRA